MTRNADGTATTFGYPDKNTTIETNWEYFDLMGGLISPITIKKFVVDDWGNPQYYLNQDGATGLVLDQRTYSYTDPLRRNYFVTDLAGRVTQYDYDCCNLEGIADPELVCTTFSYDKLKRLVASRVTRGPSDPGIIITNVLDTLGRVLVTKRVGTNEAVITLHQYQ